MTTLADNLVAALPLIARLGGGMAVLTDREGHCLAAVDRFGQIAPEVETQVLVLCRRAAASGATQSLVDPITGMEQLAIPLEAYVLFASNAGEVKRRNELFNTLKETLPLIAKVAGGEAVLFDKEGRRIFTADPIHGTAKVGPGTISEPCGDVMRTGRANIGPSWSVAGAMAVRIPISPAFGFGFNNSAAARQKERLLDQVKSAGTGKYSWDDIVGSSAELLAVLDVAKKAAESASSVMLVGESGTGKELFAQAIHNASARVHGPFVAINCSAIPESLVESALFGYEAGAFTGAQKRGSAGLFEQARGGTLLLDEISEMPLDAQAKLLRVLQEREVTRIGSAKPIPIDVRIICTSNRDLLREMREGRFRGDLYYRLNVINIHLPPLRDRKDDIPEVATRILDRLCRQTGRFISAVEPAAMAQLKAYGWPGNCRELQNVLERAVNLADGDVLQPHHFSEPALGPVPETNAGDEGAAFLAGQVAFAEERVILEVLKKNGGRRVQTAQELGISVTTLWRRLKRMRSDHGVAI
jgi:DNA-binding NtrC family response regulator